MIPAAVVLILGLARSPGVTATDDHVPSKLQLFWEAIVKRVNTRSRTTSAGCTRSSCRSPSALFFFILFANWLELMPTELNHDTAPAASATADTNLTYALALMVIVGV